MIFDHLCHVDCDLSTHFFGLIFMAFIAFPGTSMCVNLWLSTFRCGFCFHTASVLLFCGVRYQV
jgi:hypothetical protein